MSKWQNEGDEIQLNEDSCVGYASCTEEAEAICKTHNKDIDTLSNRLDEARRMPPIERDYNPGPDWLSKVVVVWTEDDAPVPDKERTSEALERFMGPHMGKTPPHPITVVDHGDAFDYLFQGGIVMSIYPEGGDIGFVYKAKKR